MITVPAVPTRFAFMRSISSLEGIAVAFSES